MNKDPSVFLEHVIDSMNNIESFIKGINKEDFLKNREKQSAIIREIEIIGEAIKNLPENIKDKYPDIPWREIAGTRDKITHQYFKINLDIVWEIIKIEIPKLKKEILEIKKDIER